MHTTCRSFGATADEEPSYAAAQGIFSGTPVCCEASRQLLMAHPNDCNLQRTVAGQLHAADTFQRNRYGGHVRTPHECELRQDSTVIRPQLALVWASLEIACVDFCRQQRVEQHCRSSASQALSSPTLSSSASFRKLCTLGVMRVSEPVLDESTSASNASDNEGSASSRSEAGTEQEHDASSSDSDLQDVEVKLCRFSL